MRNHTRTGDGQVGFVELSENGKALFMKPLAENDIDHGGIDAIFFERVA